LLCRTPSRAQARNQTLAITEYFGVDQAQHRNAARIEVSRFLRILTPARLGAVIATIDFDGELDVWKVEIDDPVANWPFALEFANERTIAQMIENAFELGFCRRGLKASYIGEIALPGQ